jgi:hypothetical protein
MLNTTRASLNLTSFEWSKVKPFGTSTGLMTHLVGFGK